MFSYSEKTQAQPAHKPAHAEEAFDLNLSDLQDWFLEASCCSSKAAGLSWFMKRCGDQRLRDFIGRLTCSTCGGKPAYVHIQDAPYYQPGIAGACRFILIGNEGSSWQRQARMRDDARKAAAADPLR